MTTYSRLWRHVSCGLSVLVLLSRAVWAEGGQEVADGPVGSAITAITYDAVPAAPIDEPPARRDRVADKKFWLLGGALVSATLLDTKSTFDTLSRCERCFESNPYAAIFIDRGPAVGYAAAVAFDVGIMVVAAKMRASSKPQIQRIWWVAPAVIAGIHLNAYRHNRSVGR